MAVWQFEIILLSQRWLGAGGRVESLSSDEGHNRAAAWRAIDSVALERRMDSVLPRATSWSSSHRLWGTYEADAIELWRNSEEIVRVSVRFDLRTPNMDLFSAVIAAAGELELAILDLGRQRIVARDVTALLRAAAESSAAHFVLDPLSFLSQVDTENAKEI